MELFPRPQPASVGQHPFVWLVVALCTVSYLVLLSQGVDALHLLFMPNNLSTLGSAPWQLWTPSFVHYTFAHLFANVYFWWLFGAKIEAKSRLELGLITAVIAAVSNLCQWLVTGPHFGGLSGVVYGLLGYSWMRARLGDSHYAVDRRILWILLALIPIAATGLFGKFSDAAHIGGLISGGALALIAKPILKSQGSH